MLDGLLAACRSGRYEQLELAVNDLILEGYAAAQVSGGGGGAMTSSWRGTPPHRSVGGGGNDLILEGYAAAQVSGGGGNDLILEGYAAAQVSGGGGQ